ncbi:MAG: Transcriptional regulator, PadR family [uncultured Cytophagales bacterium]|uniref:Transcriptional regulator, PadR family n=1 Tax=uncultured Cytophagales bacterium TaxID=158755 RepID=A0A6J4JAA9_9SPHI|nr:MAG: Transcriptional regulator, PadR family [uncultured Cytophagales bacterium]
MRRTFLGEFEEIILLVVAASATEAYGVSVWEELQQQTGRTITLSAVHTTLYRLEDKGFLSSSMGGATQERGGRRKRYFALTAAGLRALREIELLRQKLWHAIPAARLQLLGT